MVVGAGTLHALHITPFDDLMLTYDSLSVEDGRSRLIVSRSPARRLLRHLSPHKTTFRWMAYMDTNDSIRPSVDAIQTAVGSWAAEHPGGVVIIEGLDAVFDEAGPVPVFALLAWLTDLSHEHQLSVHMVLDPLTFPSNVWMRLSPLLASAATDDTVPDDGTNANTVTPPSENTDAPSAEPQPPVLAQLVSLPSVGFHRNLLSKRMLQWRRMGFDLSELEPALNMSNDGDAYALYSTVEQRIRVATEALLQMHGSTDLFSVAELERWSYRLFNLVDVEATSSIVLARTSSS
jgi:hypothetical protein